MNKAAVYRAFDGKGQLLYVGSSEQLAIRMKAHARSKPWWTDVTRITAQFYPSRGAAYRAEHIAFQAERPLYNVRVREINKRHCHLCGGRIAPRDLALDSELVAHEKCSSRT